MNRSRWSIFLSLIVVLGLAGAAWACTGQPQVVAISPQSGPAGIEVTVKGQMITGGPVEIRWNGNGIAEGLKLADSFSGPGGQLSASVPVPRVSPGVYYITIEAGDRSIARASFEVTGEAAIERGAPTVMQTSRAVAGDLWTGMRQSSSFGAGIEGDAQSDNSPTAIGLGLGLSALGLASLLVTIIATARRRRAY